MKSLGKLSGPIAMRQAIDAVLNNVPLKEYSKTHKDLQVALKQWKL
jgi:ribulose-bisphosphate carboxylase large chain